MVFADDKENAEGWESMEKKLLSPGSSVLLLLVGFIETFK